jgi:hypothetical protein
MSHLWPIFPLACLAVWMLPPAARPPVVRGHAPPGATVRVKGTAHATIADAFGRFTLPAGERLTASLPGFFIRGAAGRDGVRFRLSPLPAEDHEGYEWAAPAECATCHQRTHDEWAGGAHARSATGAGFRRQYERLLEEKPDGAGVCTSCHAPGLRDDDPAFFDLRRVSGPLSGVHCDYCHKVSGLNDGDIGLTHGRFLLRLLRPKEGQLFFGPRDDADRGEDAHSPLYRDSRYCAACHEGNVFGVPVYTTYSEWRESPAGRAGVACQDCHMKPQAGRMAGHADGLELLKRCLEVEVGFVHLAGGTIAEVRLTARDVGHRVPTGFVERRLVMTIEAGERREEVNFARRVMEPFWRGEPSGDTRLEPGVAYVRRVALPAGAKGVRVRLTHFRFQTQPDEGRVVLQREWAW